MKAVIFFACSAVSLLLLPEGTSSTVVNPCCSYPCQNSGMCMRVGLEGYKCDCTRTGFSGEQCNVPDFWSKLHIMMMPSAPVTEYILTHFHKFWDFVNNSSLRDTFMKLVLTVRMNMIPIIPTYNTKYGYLNWEAYSNISYYTRILPPVPEDCPVPMGTKGKAVLPCAEELVERFFKRREFKPDPQGTNVMFAYMAHHFTHQFFNTDLKHGSAFTLATGHGVDGSHIYGVNLERQLKLRSGQDGKLKFQVVNGDVYPPSVKEANVMMRYPKTIPLAQQLAIGNPLFGLVPGLSLYATIWLREHNRLCDLLKEEHPTWDDEQLFQTARLIVIGQTIKIIIEEYVQQLSGYLFKLKFDPTMIFKEQFQYSNRIALEFQQLYHWHSLLPNSYIINGDHIAYENFLYNTTLLMDYGVEKLVDSFSRQPAGQITGGFNFQAEICRVIISLIKESRKARTQPFNEYRKKFGLKPYKSFSELTDDKEISQGLEELYGDIDALEFYPGLILEGTPSNRILGESMLQMGSPFSLKGLLGNAICSPGYWKPSTFGGEKFFKIIKTATLKKLVCRNTKYCPYVSYRVPQK